MQKIYRCALAVALVALSASYSYAAPGELKLTISNGRVTIVADQVPVSRILAEWSRVGQTRIVNGERLLTNVSLEVIDWPERKALDLVLRSASGYMAAERQGVAANPSASTFDRVMILPFSKGPANTMPVASTPAPFNPRPMPQQQPEVDDDQPVVVPPPVQHADPGDARDAAGTAERARSAATAGQSERADNTAASGDVAADQPAAGAVRNGSRRSAEATRRWWRPQLVRSH